jgi:hypothetical protein
MEIFFNIFKLFCCADIKNNLKKIKKLHFNVFLSEKHFELSSLPQSQTGQHNTKNLNCTPR